MRVGGGADGNRARTYNMNELQQQDSAENKITAEQFSQMRVGGGADGNKARTYNINDMSVTDSRVTPDKFDQIRVGGGADGNIDDDSPIPNKLDSTRMIKSPGPRQQRN